MNLNTGFFAAYNHRHKQPTINYRLPYPNQHTSFLKNIRSSIENIHSNEPFLPSITKTTTNGNNEGYRPYRRNDFANNHLFIAKQKLAGIFLNQPTMNIQLKNDLIHLFDQYEPKQKNHKLNKNKLQEINSDSKSLPTLDQNLHLSIINLTMKPSIPLSQSRDPLSTISHRRTQTKHYQTKTPRPSIEWINPAIKQHIQLTTNYIIEDVLEPNTIINELIDNNPDVIKSTNNPLDSSLLYVKSIIPSAGLQNH